MIKMNSKLEKMPVVSFDFDLKTGKTTREHESFIYTDEELDCEHFHNLDGTGAINTCIGNEPYSCHRAKKEGLCHKQMDKTKCQQ